ncbi:hypothetical protein NLX77_03450 [Serratia marcescens]|uniref:FimD/PapC N-terminal domain-containing protein n=1 Tax=Serratia marcescens TaxID=615 RepID=UPI0020C2171B|nr:FimD/PapC N-terminal domain-containing protein [Serratia marcescens]UTL86723.1 hypothetical protein NLX77_03450 [Serratia marcescens]
MSIRQSASALLFLLVWPMTKTAASGFDVKTLAQLGYNADIAAFFNTARFLPGVHRVMLEVNAAQRYQEEVRFDSEGELCLDERLAQTLRLRVASPPGRCERLETYWPQAVVRVFPGAFRVEITLPEVAFDPDKLRTEQSGGHALLLNYGSLRQPPPGALRQSADAAGDAGAGHQPQQLGTAQPFELQQRRER